MLVLAITIRNELAHGDPTDAWIEETASALDALVRFTGERLHVPADIAPGWPAPWFTATPDGVAVFTGLDDDGARYAPWAGGLVVRPGADSEVLASIGRLTGAEAVERDKLRRQLGQLAPEELQGVLLDDFLVGRKLGEGGFGTVHLARQLSTGRQVAVKLLHAGLGEEVKARFAQEARLLAQFDHPNIVRVIGSGEAVWRVPRDFSPAGQPWFDELAGSPRRRCWLAMEWVRGRTLEEVYRSERPPVAALADWMRQSAEALEAVHAAGLVHRDVKPSNLMVSERGLVKLMDFGVARSQSEERTLYTETGRQLGSPPYMSPEQLRARDADAEVGPLSDVYSLCATFYELFTRHRLYAHETTDARTVEAKKLTGELPARPRALLATLPWEIETIVMGGLEPLAADRYRSTGALARDLRHVAVNEPIEYRRPSLVRRAVLAYRRNRVVVISTAAVLAVIVTATGLVYRAAQGERREAERARAGAIVSGARTVAERDPLEASLLLIELPAGASPPDATAVAVGLARTMVPAVLLSGHVQSVMEASFSPDGRRVVTASADGTARVWDAEGRGEPVVLKGHEREVRSATFSPDGRRIVTASKDLTARVWDAEGRGEPVVLRGHERGVLSASFSPDGRRVLTASEDGTARVWDAEGRGEPVVLRGHQAGVGVRSASFGPDGRRVLTASGDGTARVWDAEGRGEPVVLMGHERGVLSASFSPDGRRVVTTSFDGTARVWRVDLHDVLDHLRARTTACLSNADRVRYLGEDDATAITRRDQCERRYGREPGAREPGSSR